MPWGQPLDWLKLPSHVLLGLVLVVGLLLWGPSWFITGLGLQAFIDEYRKFLGVAFLLLIAPAAGAAGKMGYETARARWEWRKARQTRLRRLENLTAPEKAILRGYIERDTRTQTLDFSDGVTRGLEAEYVIARASTVGRYVTHFDYNIQPWAWEYLRDHRGLLADAGGVDA